MNKLKIKQQTGIGLLELTLSLAIIGIILIMATRFYASSSESRKLAEANDQLGIIQNAMERWLLTNPDFSNIKNKSSFQDFVDRNYLPSSYENPKNPWGYEVTVFFGSDSQASVTYGKAVYTVLPEAPAFKLKTQYESILCQSYILYGNPVIDCFGNGMCDLSFYFYDTCRS